MAKGLKKTLKKDWKKIKSLAKNKKVQKGAIIAGAVVAAAAAAYATKRIIDARKKKTLKSRVQVQKNKLKKAIKKDLKKIEKRL